MRYILSVDLEDDGDIEAFLKFVKYHSKRLNCPPKDVFIKLAQEWEKQQTTPIVEKVPEPEPKKLKPKRKKLDDRYLGD